MIISRQLYRKWGMIGGTLLTLKQVFFSFFHSFSRRKRKASDLMIERPVKGVPYLTISENGNLRCTGCDLCKAICPSQCIHIESLRSDGDEYEREVVSFNLEILRCMFCGLCEEVCPVDAIRMSEDTEVANFAEHQWVMDYRDLAFRKSLNDGEGIVSTEKCGPLQLPPS